MLKLVLAAGLTAAAFAPALACPRHDVTAEAKQTTVVAQAELPMSKPAAASAADDESGDRAVEPTPAAAVAQ